MGARVKTLPIAGAPRLKPPMVLRRAYCRARGHRFVERDLLADGWCLLWCGRCERWPHA